RRHCRMVAEFAFRHARTIGAKVFGGPKYTVSPVYEGLLKEEMDAAAARHPDVPYDPQLIDAVFALLLQSTASGCRGGAGLSVAKVTRWRAEQHASRFTRCSDLRRRPTSLQNEGILSCLCLAYGKVCSFPRRT
ncbi:MAG: hypothetical protein QXQ81_08850, partial [Candidatus Thorarchaeota archaeon]